MILKRNYKKIIQKISFLGVLVVVMLGQFSQRASAAGLVPCEGIDDCNFDTFVSMLNKLASFIIYRLPVILLVVMIAWNGIVLLINRDRPAVWKIISKNLLNIVWGYLLIVGAYLIVKTFITLLAGEDLTFKVFFN